MYRIRTLFLHLIYDHVTHILLMTSKFRLCSPSTSRLPHHDIQWSGGKRASISINKVPGMTESLFSAYLNEFPICRTTWRVAIG